MKKLGTDQYLTGITFLLSPYQTHDKPMTTHVFHGLLSFNMLFIPVKIKPGTGYSSTRF